jgi:uncharacterized membrane protein YdjX (TVP38/TMEM64 family)
VTGKRIRLQLRLATLPVVVIVAVLVAWKLGYFQLDHRREMVGTVQHLRGLRWAEVAYVFAYGLAITVVLPATIVTLLGGAMFGAWMGAALAWGGALVGTLFTHLLARYVARTPMRRLFGEHRLLRQLRENDTVAGLLRLRVLPVAPFAVLDYVAGVAGVSLRRLLVATALGVIPSVVAYAYVGAELMKGIESGNDASHRALWIAGIVTLAMLVFSVAPRILRKFRSPDSL